MTFDFSAVANAAPYLAQGMVFTVELTVFALAGGLVIGTFIAIVRHMHVPVLARLFGWYVTLMRSLPLILVLFWFFFLVPIVLGHLAGVGRPIPIGPTYTAFITFGLFETAYYSEIIRVGLRSVNRGQFEACQALGLSTFDTYRSVVMPQALKVASPIILSQTIILFQDTSLVYVLSLTDLVGAASKVAQLNSRLVEMYLTVAVIYLAICSAASQCVAAIRKRNELPRGAR
jgi:glutamate/aspartate transport system permease protein